MALWGFERCVHFQGLLRRCAPRAAFGGANRHPRITLRSPLLYRSDVVLPLKAQPKKKRCKSIPSGTTSPLRGSCHCCAMGRTEGAGTKYTPCGVCALSGTTSSLRSSCRLRRGEPTSENNITFSPTLSFGCGSSPESATKEKEMQKHSFRDYFAPSGLVPLLRNGANRHPRLAVRSPLLYRSDVVLPLKAQPKKKRCKNASLFSWCTNAFNIRIVSGFYFGEKHRF